MEGCALDVITEAESAHVASEAKLTNMHKTGFRAS